MPVRPARPAKDRGIGRFGPEAKSSGAPLWAKRPSETLPEPATLRSVTLLNFRDVGGRPTQPGRRLRTGLLYRSADLSRLDEGDRARLEELGIRTVVDLRTEAERDRWPEASRLPKGATYIVADVLADAAEGTPAQFMPLMDDPAAVESILGGGKGLALFERHYRDFVRLPSARAAYRRLFGALLDGERRPLVFHCTTGKDRTGWAAAALQLLLGVPEEAVVEDYLRSNGALEPLIGPLLAEFEARGGNPALLEPLAGVRRSYLEAALDEVADRYGSIEGYFRSGLGFDDRDLEALVETCLEP